MSVNIPYLSASRIHAFEQCPQLFFNNYINGVRDIDRTTNWYADYGTLLHDIAERIGKGEVESYEVAKSLYDGEFTNVDIPDTQRGEYYRQGKSSLINMIKELKNMKIIDVEKEFYVPIDFSTPPLHGYIDLVYRDEKDRLIVRDYKTSRVYGKTQMDKQYQPHMYTLACKSIYGEYPHVFEFDFIRFGEKRQIIIDDNFIKMSEIKIKGVWQRMKDSDWNAEYNPFFCDNFCDVRSICPLFLKKQRYL